MHQAGAGHDESHEGDDNHGGHEVRRDDVGQLLDRRPAALRLSDHGDDARQKRLGPDLLGTHHQPAGPVDGRPDDLVARGLLDGDRLAGDHRLVDVARALEHLAIDRDLFARTDAQLVTFLHLLKRHVFFAPVVTNQAGGFGGHSKELLDGGAGLAPRLELEHLTEQDERDDHSSRLEVHGHLTAVGAEGLGEDTRRHGRDGAVAVRHAHAEADQREHVEAHVLHRPGGADVEWPRRPEADGRRQR